MKNIIILLLCVCSFSAIAKVKTGTFTSPTKRVDNTPLNATEIASYNIYYNGVAEEIISGNATTFIVDRPYGTYDIYLTTVDTEGRESLPSNTFQLILAPANPNPPVIIIIQ
jgi:hypothetical protein